MSWILQRVRAHSQVPVTCAEQWTGAISNIAFHKANRASVMNTRGLVRSLVVLLIKQPKGSEAAMNGAAGTIASLSEEEELLVLLAHQLTTVCDADDSV